MSAASEPVRSYDFPIGAGVPNGWHRANRYLIWTGAEAPDAPAYAIQERLADGPHTLPLRDRSMSLIPAGTPHRLTHLFGFWRISDADLIVVRAALTETTVTALYVSSGPQHVHDRLLWYCGSCTAELAGWTCDVRRSGAEGFWNRALDDVRAFNADPARRTCPACGTLHHRAYGFDRDADTADERAARAAW